MRRSRAPGVESRERVSDAAPLAGRTALVTGASRGIGRRTAELLAAAGARVWCLARSADVVREVAAGIGGEALVADLTDDQDVWDAVDHMRDASGSAPDLVVNAAGVFGLVPSSAETVKGLDAALAINLRAPVLVNRAVLPGMLERGSGLIVNVGSVAGHRAMPGNASYSASKYGLRGYHEVLLEELRGTGVRATLVEPAATDTRLWDPHDPDGHPDLPDRSAMLRPEDVAEAILFVATRPGSVRIPLLRIERA
ncbi:MAG TPA: SDR family oxidoreductase [Longimicrobiales bacterium]|nr:SDR family oxidoreductase [Longimicrobiales bacterium]